MDKEEKHESAASRGKHVPETITVDDSTSDNTPLRQNAVLGIAYKSPFNWSWKNSSLSLTPIVGTGSQNSPSMIGMRVIETVDISESPDMFPRTNVPDTLKINRPDRSFQTQSHFNSAACDNPDSSTLKPANIVCDVICNVRKQQDSHPAATSTSSEATVGKITVPLAEVLCVDLVNTPLSDKSGSRKGLSIKERVQLRSVNMVKTFVNVDKPTMGLKATSHEKLHEIIADALKSDFKDVESVQVESMDATSLNDSIVSKADFNRPTTSLKSTSHEKLHEIISDGLNNDFKDVDPAQVQSMDVTLLNDPDASEADVNFPSTGLKAASNEKLHEMISDALNNDLTVCLEPEIHDQSMDITLINDSFASETDSSVDNLTSNVDMLTLLNKLVDKTSKKKGKKRPRDSSSSLSEEGNNKKSGCLSQRARKKIKKNESNASSPEKVVNVSQKTPSENPSVTKVTYDACSKTLSVNLIQQVPGETIVPKDDVGLLKEMDKKKVVSTNFNETITIDDEDISVVDKDISVVDVKPSGTSPPLHILPKHGTGNNFVVTIRDNDRIVNKVSSNNNVASKVPSFNNTICLDDQDSSDEITVVLDACPQVGKPMNDDVIIVRSKKKNKKTKDEAQYIAALRRAHKIALFESQKMEKLLSESRQVLGFDTDRATGNGTSAPAASYIPLIHDHRHVQRIGNHHEVPAVSRPMAENRSQGAGTRWGPSFPNLFGLSNPAAAAYVLPQASGPSERPQNHTPRSHGASHNTGAEYPLSPPTPNVFGNNFSNPDKSVPKTGLRPIIIDGSNVAMGHGSNGSTFSSRGLEICVRFFLKKGHKVIAFVPLYRRSSALTTDCHILERLERETHLVFTPSRYVDGRTEVPYDDRYIVQTAAELGGVIVSKDNYRDLLAENPHYSDTIKNRLLMFTWVGDMIMFPQDPLGRHGPTLDEFLRFDKPGYRR